MGKRNLHSIQEVVAATGLTSRTLRHYDAIGLLPATELNHAQVRYYDDQALLRLQTILVMRELGLPLEEIAELLQKPQNKVAVLETHLRRLRTKVAQISQMIASSEATINNLKKGQEIKMSEMFEGFDHTKYQDEVEQRWGKQAYADSDKWWRSMSELERETWKQTQNQLIADWVAAAISGIEPTSEQAQALAARQEAWLGSIPGTPGFGTGVVPSAYILGLAEMYVADPRFAKNYGGDEGARFVKAAIEHWVATRK